MRVVRKIAYWVIFICLICIMIISGYNVYKSGKGYLKARNTYKEINNLAFTDPTKFTGEIDWEKLKKINPDIVGWIYLKDTPINYPVVKGSDNDYYLHRLMDGTSNFAGTLFVDCNNEDNFEGFNTIIYGHHMKDGTMFAAIKYYTEKSDFYEDHKNIEFITPNEKYHLKVFSAFQTTATSYVYNYEFYDENDKSSHIEKLINENRIHNVDSMNISSKDHLITLSTCTYATGDERTVVIGKLVPWSIEEKVDALKTKKLNSN